MKITPLSPSASNFSFSQNNEQGKDFSQDSKQDSRNSKQKQDFLGIMRETLNKKEINNDNTNAISPNGTTPIRTLTDSYGSRDGGNYRYNVGTQGQSANVRENRGNNATTYNGSIAELLKEKDERSRSLGAGSERITRLRNAKAYTTTEERSRLDRLEKLEKAFKAQQAIKFYKKHTKLHKQHKNSLNQHFEMGGFA